MKTIDFQKALSLLLKGDPVALPTETVYGLAGRMDRDKTLERIFSLKRRPFFDPLIVHCYNRNQALSLVSGDPSSVKCFFKAFSPGPLTVVAYKNKKVSPWITAGKSTVALRIPRHPLMRKILQRLPVPLVAPSANLYGKVSPVKASHVLSNFSGKVPVLDGGESKVGVESTIIWPDTKKNKLFILRPGAVTKEDIEAFIKKERLDFIVEHKKVLVQPGGQKSHYKPKAPLYILKTKKRDSGIKEFLTGKFPNKIIKKLDLHDSPQKTARLLYTRLIELSCGKDSLIFVKKTAQYKGGLWESIWDRLQKASSGYYEF